MPYQAHKPDLYNNVGSSPTAGPQVDIGEAIQALTGGATSLIHATLLRKQAEAGRQHQEAELALQTQREGREADQQTWERGFKEKEARRKFMTEGGVPEHTEMQPAPSMASVNMPSGPTGPTAQIARALTPQSSMPSIANTPTAAPVGPSTAPLPSSKLKQTTVPESIDPTRSEAFIRSTAVADANAKSREAVEARRGTERKSAAEAALQGKITLKKMDEANKKSPLAKSMTEFQRHRAAVLQAGYFLRQFENPKDAMDAFDGPEGKDLRDAGVTKAHMREAFVPISDAEDKERAAAERLAASQTNRKTPRQAVGDITEVRRLLRPAPGATKSTTDAATEVLTPTTASPFKKTGAKPVAAAPVAAASAPPAATAPAKPADESTVSDADLWEQKVAGGMTKEAATAYVKGRKKPKAP